MNIFFKILAVVIILSTISILAIKPEMHKKVLIYDSSYTIVENVPQTDIETIIPEKKQETTVKKAVSKEVKKEIQKSNPEPKKVVTEKKSQIQPKKEISQIAPAKSKIEQKQNQISTQKQPEKIVATTKPTTKTVEPKKIETVNKIQPQEKILTQQEEEIAWNIWRSNLQNQIMKDTKLPYIPKGTVFKFSFDVDKYGRIANIKTWSTNPNYTPYAIQYIAPVIRSYQGKNILDFPIGTQRQSTTFTGGWKISDNAVYSTPNDYNDIEKVKK